MVVIERLLSLVISCKTICPQVEQYISPWMISLPIAYSYVLKVHKEVLREVWR